MFFMLVSFTQLSGQATYTWIGADNAAWNVSTNWNPTRNTPATTDILLFSSGTTLTITTLPNQTVGNLNIKQYQDHPGKRH